MPFSASLFEELEIDSDTAVQTQLRYLAHYLGVDLLCQTVVRESHYVDRDFVEDVALFYSRNLRDYPNYCRRWHFFRERFTQKDWTELVATSGVPGGLQAGEQLQAGYLGFTVIRPLPFSPIGRTVLPPVGSVSESGKRRQIDAVRPYRVHLAGLPFDVTGLAWAQQDRGVSACATVALWSALHRSAYAEGTSTPTPAEITESATRFFLPGGRSLPSEGLTVQQLSEATRAAGLSPIVVHATSPEVDRAQIMGYVESGIAPVLSLYTGKREGHAVCCVGVRHGAGVRELRRREDRKYIDLSAAVDAVYIHDDRLGPYAIATLHELESEDRSESTSLQLAFPDNNKPEISWLRALVIPVPLTLRLSLSSIRELGVVVADALGDQLATEYEADVTLKCRYYGMQAYLDQARSFDLTPAGYYKLSCETPLSRYVGVIEIGVRDGALFDIVLDCTESEADSAKLALVWRAGGTDVPVEIAEIFADTHGVPAIV